MNLPTLDKTSVDNSSLHRYGAGDDLHEYLSSIYVTLTDDIEAARNEVISSEEGLVMYELNGQCEEMKLCTVIKATRLLKRRMTLNKDSTDDEHSKRERQKKLLSEWLNTTKNPPNRPEAQPTRRPPQAPVVIPKQKTPSKHKAEPSSKPDGEEESGLICNKVDSKGNPIYTAIPSGMKTVSEKYDFTAIYMIEKRKLGTQCLIHWGPNIEPSWVAIHNVDSRAIAEFFKRKAKAEKKGQPEGGDAFEILFEEARSEDGDHKLDRRFLVRWVETGIVTWEVYGGDPGVTRMDGQEFLKRSKMWKRYWYL
ncbi:hypothetical protein EYC80_001381 [Monilinia laxa]|uniref:Chromo domain-containing protein n=1 Tax=Monilinia laxa TaxID=61186 RepID=A0A5N6K9A1_MONLA|nr:hypothetical protein EYC80_001381 [Monilinia laxa]